MSTESKKLSCESKTCVCKNKINNKEKSQEDNEPIWWVNSPQHGNCFWAYIKDKSGPDGSMSELVQAEIAELMGWSNTKTHFMLKQAMTELIDTLKANRANELLHNDHYQIVDLPNIELAATEESDS